MHSGGISNTLNSVHEALIGLINNKNKQTTNQTKLKPNKQANI